MAGAWRLRRGFPAADAVASAFDDRVRRVVFDTHDLAGWDSSLVTVLAQVLDRCRGRHLDIERTGLPAAVHRPAPARFAGSLVIGALPVLAILVSSLRPASLALFALRETVAIGVGTVVAALIPAARRRQSFAYGLLLPVAVALVSLLARGPAVEPPR